MNYSILIYETVEDFAVRSDPAKNEAHFAAWMQYFQRVREAGIMRGGNGLMPPDTATTVKLRNGQRLIEDGPYADTKEQLGGVFVIEALSVILQVGSFKLRGKRIFRMAPLHHHFEQLGWAESKIIARFWIFGLILALFALTTLKLR